MCFSARRQREVYQIPWNTQWTRAYTLMLVGRTTHGDTPACPSRLCGPAVDAECKKVYFAGDTGPQFVRRQGSRGRGRETRVPRAQGDWEYFGGFDLAMIPIIAYEPKWFMLNIHCVPQDGVHIVKGIRAKKVITMHWGCRPGA
ncbi:hypothetical protein ARMGADRAFT_434527 [Armillaria gallica]|uniref:Metallo-beta-lactamase domain-containing protein n=1 Tax=Armillaria gallica TaxID=47427 RepID=A0A2H3D352_ARMGA|nr:hypothetical protein ARMGADRAFT_434527 [Armillaria gallica]